MAEDEGWPQTVLFDKFPQVFSHDRVVHHVAVRRLAVVAQIDAVNFVEGGQPFTHGAPIIRGAEKAVENDQRVAVTLKLKVEAHSF